MSEPAAARLEQAHADVADQLRRADAKAGSLLPLFSAFLAGAITLATRVLPPTAEVLLWAAAAPMAASVAVLLSVVRPRVGRGAHGFARIARLDPAEWLTELAVESTLEAQAADVHRLAALARAKYQRVRTAVDLLKVGLLLVAAALTVLAVTG